MVVRTIVENSYTEFGLNEKKNCWDFVCAFLWISNNAIIF